MFQTRFEGGFSKAEQTFTLSACKQVLDASAQLTAGIGTQKWDMHRRFWFGTFPANTIAANITRMNNVITDNDIKITFVCRKNGELYARYSSIDAPPGLVDKGNPNVEHVGGVAVPLAQPHDPSLKPVYGYVFPNQGGGSPKMSHHVGSGIRLYLANQYIDLPLGSYERAQTIYHELTHKTLGTEDHMYESRPCRQLAVSDPNKAGCNADSYAWFAMTYSGLAKEIVVS